MDAPFRAAFDASPRPLLLIAADGGRFEMVAVNPAHARAFGTTPEALTGWGVFEVFPEALDAEGAAFVAAIRASFERVLATGAADQMPTRSLSVPGPDGGEPMERYWSAMNVPLTGADGRVTHILSAIQDVTGEVLERRSEEARVLLMREVDHRARNALTIVQSVLRLTQAGSIEEFKAVVTGRVDALARAQTSLAERKWEGASLRGLVADELRALAVETPCDVTGPSVLLDAEQVQPMSMILHELATNACKYGALSTPEGSLAIGWTVEPDGGLSLTWEERSGPAVTAPERTGFGSRLVIQLAQQLGGAVRFDWRPEGLRVELTAGAVG